jgi:AraC-like DNA-binding protein
VHRREELRGVALSAVDVVGASPPRVSLDFTVALNLGHAHRYLARGSSWTVQPGALIMCEPGEVHAAEPCAERIRVDVLFIGADALTDPDVGAPWGEGRLGRAPIVLDGELRRRFKALAGSLQARGPGALDAEEDLFALVAAMRRARGGDDGYEHHRGGADRSAVRRARELLHDAFSEPISLDELARASRLPKMRFLRAFKREVGISPHSYQVDLRIDFARRLLASGAEVSDAAASAGFFDQSHMHRHFTRSVGVTPGVYRRCAAR